MPPDLDSPEPALAAEGALIDWRRLASAFADDTAGVQWYLDRPTGEVVCGTLEEDSLAAFAGARFVAVERARSKEQYRWMERYIAGLGDRELAMRLSHAIAGKSAFQRFKAVLVEYPGRSNEWLAFRIEQIWSHIRLWLRANDLRSAPPPRALWANWRDLSPEHARPLGGRYAALEAALAGLEADDLEDLNALAEFLQAAARDGGAAHEGPG